MGAPQIFETLIQAKHFHFCPDPIPRIQDIERNRNGER